MENQVNKKIAIVIKFGKAGNDGVLSLSKELRERGHICDFIYSDEYTEDTQYDDFLKKISDYDLIYFRVLANKTGFAKKLLNEPILKNKIILNKKYLEEADLTSKTFQMDVASKLGVDVPRFKKIKFKDINIDTISNFTKLPAIIKTSVGIAGRQVFLISSQEDLEKIPTMNEDRECIIQEFIPYDKDVRVFVINNKIWGVMERVPAEGDFKANISQGGFGRPLDNPLLHSKIDSIIQKISSRFGVEIAGYDFLIKDSDIYFLEINTNPGYKGLDKALGVKTSVAISDYIESLLS